MRPPLAKNVIRRWEKKLVFDISQWNAGDINTIASGLISLHLSFSTFSLNCENVPFGHSCN